MRREKSPLCARALVERTKLLLTRKILKSYNAVAGWGCRQRLKQGVVVG